MRTNLPPEYTPRAIGPLRHQARVTICFRLVPLAAEMLDAQTYSPYPYHSDAMDVDPPAETENGVESEYEPKGPRPIKKLSTDVINSIAAAEVSSILNGPPHPHTLSPFEELR